MQAKSASHPCGLFVVGNVSSLRGAMSGASFVKGSAGQYLGHGTTATHPAGAALGGGPLLKTPRIERARQGVSRALATLRKLRRPVVQMNVAEQQVNVTG
jgi:hypothetical protein